MINIYNENGMRKENIKYTHQCNVNVNVWPEYAIASKFLAALDN